MIMIMFNDCYYDYAYYKHYNEHNEHYKTIAELLIITINYSTQS